VLTPANSFLNVLLVMLTNNQLLTPVFLTTFGLPVPLVFVGPGGLLPLYLALL
jgi:hypothetical protein